jgi:hypothetical protein
VISTRTSICFLLTILALCPATLTQSVSAPAVPTRSPTIVIGFVGGFIRHDNLAHSEEVETFESYHKGKARRRILSLLDTDRDRTLTADEKRSARIVIYGHSWGGSAAIKLARALENDGIPVLLTVQVDSISVRHNDRVIPANVARAANFYQPNGPLRGQAAIRAADPSRTSIIGNFRSDYKAIPYNCEKYPWYDRVFVKTHTQIECDAGVWKRAEALIRSELPQTTASQTGH